MKVLAFSGSPRMKKGATDLILQHFMTGAEQAGAETETVYVAEQNIKYCEGCFNCWVVHPGRCKHKDDMPKLLGKIRRADVVVYASPVYVDGVTAQVKTMMDRFITLAKPFIVQRDGHSRHPGHGKGTRNQKQKMVLISTCGFGELDNFEPIILHMTAVAKNMGADFLGALVRPMGPMLRVLEISAPDVLKSIYEGFRQGGYEAVSKGEISEEAKKVASAPIVSMDDYVKLANMYFKMEIEKNTKQKKAG